MAQRALQRVGASVEVAAEAPVGPRPRTGWWCPGVGAFEACMTGLRKIAGERIIAERVAAGRPYGGRVGMQILFARGVEFGVEATGSADGPKPSPGWTPR